MLEGAGRGHLEDLRRPGAVVGAEHLDQLVGGPGVELALDALAVGVERGGEAALGRAQLAQQEVGGLAGDPLPQRPAATRVDAEQQAVVVEHLLEVRHHPAGVDAVAREAAAELVVHAAARHRLERPVEHRGGALATVAVQQLEHHRRRELRRAAEAAVHAVVLAAERAHRVVERRGVDRRGRGRERAGEVVAQRRRHPSYVVGPGGPRLDQRLEHLPERRLPVPRPVGEVGAGEERVAVVVEHDRHRPARRGRSSTSWPACRPRRRRAAPRGRP